MIVLKKEVIKTNNVTEHEDTDKYRQLLVRTLHSCSVRFPDMAANVIPVVSSLLLLPLTVLKLCDLTHRLVARMRVHYPVSVFLNTADGVPERH